MTSQPGLRNYAVITGAYWGFTLTDGAIRMLVVLYFHQLGYTPLTIASLFLFYEFFGIVTNLLGGWLGTRFGLNTTLYSGMLLQIVALLMLTIPAELLTVAYVMLAQALSGIAKDLNKMSAKASVKLMMPASQNMDEQESRLFKWIALLTGSKNTLKGAGFFLGGFLLTLYGFQGALYVLAGGLFIIFVVTAILLPGNMGKANRKSKFSQIFSRSSRINGLSVARFFLFGSRDVWFVVGLPLFLTSSLGWEFSEVGSFLALWVIGYGVIQAFAPRLIRRFHHGRGPDAMTAFQLVSLLSLVPVTMALLLVNELQAEFIIILGLAVFALVFAINSSLHSYLIVSWSEDDKVAMNVGFYYMANAAGRLAGTLISGWAYQSFDLVGCLVVSSIFLFAASFSSYRLSRMPG